MAADSSSKDSESPSTPQQETSSPTARKARRQTAFYPNTANIPQKPFSRSAAKRESVMALGSIEYLQHYFTKTGIAPRKNVLKPNSNLVPAIGPGLIQTDTDMPHDPQFVLPPSPMVPPPLRPAFPPFVKTYQTDPEMLKPGVIEDLEAVEHAWGLGRSDERHSKPRNPELLGGDSHSSVAGTFDVLSVLKTTTRAIRSVRNYLVSLPDDFATPRLSQTEFRPHTLSPQAALVRKVSQPESANDPLTLIRRSALDVLTVLRNLEEASRMPLSDDVYDVQSDGGSSSTRAHTPGGTERIASPFTTTSADDDNDSTASFSFSVVKVPSQKNSVPVWSDEEDNNEDEDAEMKRERWDERLVLGGGWLYRQDLTLEGLSNEREAVKTYLDAADKALFGGQDEDGQRGWEKEKERLAIEKSREAKANKGRRASAGDGEGQTLSVQTGGRRVVSTGMIDAMRDMMISEAPDEMLHSVVEEEEEEEEESGVGDDELPSWAKRSKFVHDPLGRLLNLLVSLLPSELLSLLPPPDDSDRVTLLFRLSSGQILCTAYNIAVRKSRKPWGYITKTAIHDIATLEAQASEDAEADKEKKKIGWTFRRTDNLRLWAAALKLRYMIPIGPPRNARGNTPTASPSATQVTFPSVENFMLFDPQLVAKREEGWEVMLENAVLKWMWCVVGERREGKGITMPYINTAIISVIRRVQFCDELIIVSRDGVVLGGAIKSSEVDLALDYRGIAQEAQHAKLRSKVVVGF